VASSVHQQRIAEIIKCGQDPNYFIDNYCKIERDGLIDFKMWPFQKDCVNDFLAHKRNIVLKSRQIGMSTVTAAYATWMFLFHPHSNIMIIATRLATAKLFIRKVKTIIKYLPKWMNIWGEYESENMFGIELKTGSIIKAVPTGDDAGRGEALSLMIIDEAAFIKGFDDLWTGLKPTLTTTDGRIIILSTPNGVGNMYHKLYEGSAKKWKGDIPGEGDRNRFNGIFLPWQVVPERDEEWFKSECKDMNARQIAQEYECDFVSSGDNVIGESEIRWLRGMVKAPTWREGYDRCLWVWERPKKGHSYILGADTSRGDAKDFSTFHVVDVVTSEIVAEYQGKAPPDRLAEMIDQVGRKYNNALAVVEKNSYGYATLMKLRDFRYTNIYFKDNKAIFFGDFVYNSDVSKAGFDMNSKSKPAVIAKMEEVLRNRGIKCYSDRFISELSTFIWSNGQKAKAMKGYNDDLVISMALTTWMFDVSEFSKDAVEADQIIFDAMGTQTTTVQDIKTDGQRQSDYSLWAPVAGGSSGGSTISDYAKRGGMVQGRIGHGWKWLMDD
jgi:hypothetical protein